MLVGGIQLLLLTAVAGTSLIALADSTSGDPTVNDPSTSGIDAFARPRPTPTPTPVPHPNAPYAYKDCSGNTNSDGTVSQGQSATCAVFANAGDRAYTSGEEVDIFAGPDTPIQVTGCSGTTNASYSTSGTLIGSASGAYCAFQVQSGQVQSFPTFQSLGTETFYVPGTIASGTQVHQSSRFCTAPGLDGERACTAQFAQLPINGPAATIIDEVPPTFTSTQSDIGPLDATSSSGAVASFALPTVTDNAPGPIAVSCNPPSGSVFAIGTTTVVCTATDASSNSATQTFTVLVINTFDSLCRVTVAEETNPAIAHSLCVKLEGASDAAARSDMNAADGMLNAFVNEVNAQTGNTIGASDASGLQGLAQLLM